MATEVDLDSKIRGRIHNPTVGAFYDAYLSYGMLPELASLINTIPDKYQPPIMQTVVTHVTKEKPIFVYALVERTLPKQEDYKTIAVATDFLWTLGLMYDDLLDGDGKRAGVDTSWVLFGKILTNDALRHGLDSVIKRCQLVYGEAAAQQCFYYVQRGIDSLKEHAGFHLNQVGMDALTTNYNKRSEFHTVFPLKVVKMIDGSWDKYEAAVTALIGVNFAGQVLNDLKDFSSERYFGRPSFSDIRNSLVTIPLWVLWNNLDDDQKIMFDNLYGKKEPTKEEVIFLQEAVTKTHTLTTAAQLATSEYRKSYALFLDVVKDQQNLRLIESWFAYKNSQLEEICR